MTIGLTPNHREAGGAEALSAFVLVHSGDKLIMKTALSGVAVAMLAFPGLVTPSFAAVEFGYFTQTIVTGILSDPDGNANDPVGTIQEPIDPPGGVRNQQLKVNEDTVLGDTGRFTSPRGVSARADLNEGELGVFAQSSYSGIPGSASFSSVAQARFGDTLNAQGEAGLNITLDFTVDGVIGADGPDTSLDRPSPLFTDVDVYIAIFRGTVADESNWANTLFGFDGPAPIASDRLTLSLGAGPVFGQVLDEVLSVSTTLLEEDETFQVFANMTSFAVRNANPGTTTIDLSSTGTFSLFTDPGVTVQSSSGVFPGAIVREPSVIPLPASAMLLLSALAGLFGFRKRMAE